MKTKPMLGDFALDGIEYIESSESRALAEHRVPGLAGNYFQDMGAVANTIVIAGTKNGDEARDDFLNGVRAIFNKGEQTTFVADINTATDITDVIIEDLDVAEVGGSAHSFRYQLKLRKYTKPPEPPQTSLLDTGILGDALNVLDALNALDALSSIPNLGDPTGPIRGALDNLKSTTGGLDQAVGSIRNLLSQDPSAPGGAPGSGTTPGTGSEPGAASTPQAGSTSTPSGGDSNATPGAAAPDQNGSTPAGSSPSSPGTPSAFPGVPPEEFSRRELTDESPVTSPATSAPAPQTVRALVPADGTQEETQAANSPGAESHRCEPGVPIEVGFVHFNNDRHVFMPEGPSPDPPDAETPGGGLDGLQVVANALDHSRKHPLREMLVTGHSDSTAIISYNLPLSARRADSTFCVLQGYDLKDLWVQSALRDGGHADDWRRILRWADKTFQFDCEASDPNKPDFAKDQKAITNFQKNYNAEVDKLAGNNTFAPGWAQKIPGSQLGFVGLSTWQAFFDCYQRDLVRQLSLSTQAELTAVQQKVSLVKIPTQGCSEFHSRDLTERAARRAAGYPEKVGPKEPRDRRVEILFFDPGEAPPFECHPTTDINHCEPSKCVLYANQQFPQRPLPVIGAAPATTVALDSIEVKRRSKGEFEEGRSFTPLVNDQIKFRVKLTNLTTPFDGKVRVTLSRETTNGLTAVAVAETQFCADDAETTVDVVWDGNADRAVPRQISNRTTPDLNPGASPENIPLREMNEGDVVRHGVYVAEKIELLEKDDSVFTTANVPAADGAFVVTLPCTLFFNTALFVSSLGHFGFGDGTDFDAPYIAQIKQAILTVTSSHFGGIGIEFFTSKSRSAARGLMIEFRDVAAFADGAAGTIVPGGTALQETGDGFRVTSNIYGWTESTFFVKPDGDQFDIEVGPDGLLNRNVDQNSDDSKALNETFGPLGVERDSQSDPFRDVPQTPKPTRERTVTNGKVEGRVTKTEDVANTSVSLSDTGVFTVSSTNPTIVPTQRATEIQRALNAFATSVGIIAAHELGHALGLIARTSATRATITVEGRAFLSPLAGIDEAHHPTATGQLMDKGEDTRFRVIFQPGTRRPLGDANRRYLTDCFPAEP